MLKLIATTLIAFLLLPAVAAAQEAAAPGSTGIDFSGVMASLQAVVVTAVLGVLTVLAAFAQKKLDQWFDGKIKVNDLVSDEMMERTARSVVRLGYAHALRVLGKTEKDLENVDLDNTALEFAVKFLTQQYPEVREWIEGKVKSSVDQWVAAARRQDLALKAA